MQANNISPLVLPSANKKFLLLFFICCALPFILAKLALEFSWFAAGSTNKGQWLKHEIHLLPASAQTHWRLVYVQAQTCDANCELALYSLQQIHTGLGRKQIQIHNLVLAEKPPSQLTRYASIQWLSANSLLPELQNHIVIVNQQGVALLRYPTINNQQKMVAVAKDIRADLRRLMNYDRSNF